MTKDENADMVSRYLAGDPTVSVTGGASSHEMWDKPQEEPLRDLQLPVVRYGQESDQDLVKGALDFYGVDTFLVQGVVVPGMSENGHPVVCFTGDAEELEKLRVSYDRY